MKNILFTAVGSTDPIAGYHDGAILHIVRHFDIDCVYLYYSKEMCEIDARDNRYVYCLEKLKELTGKQFEIMKIKKEDLVDVHIFDYFLTEFRTILESIHNDESQIFVNISSGTPAMKGALQTLAALGDQKLIPVQVSTPAKAYNENREDVKGEYEVSLQWEMNEDNEKNAANRCAISSNANLTAEIKKNIIKKMLHSYNYVAALTIAEEISDFLPEEAFKLIKASVARLKLDKKSIQIYLKNVDYKMFPHETSSEWDLFEYLMLCRIKIQKQEYADFLRSISPIFFALLEKAVNRELGIEVTDYYDIKRGVNGTVFKKWDPYRAVNDPRLVAVLTRDGTRDLVPEVAGSVHMVDLLKRYSNNSALLTLVDDLRKIEIEIRNPASHCITYMTEDVIKNATGITAMQIFNKLKQLMKHCGIKITDEDLKTYDCCNERIIRLMESI